MNSKQQLLVIGLLILLQVGCRSPKPPPPTSQPAVSEGGRPTPTIESATAEPTATEAPAPTETAVNAITTPAVQTATSESPSPEPTAVPTPTPPVFVEQPAYKGNCSQRPAGSTCITFDDGYIWLVHDTILSHHRDDPWQGHPVQVVQGLKASYHHALDTNWIKEEPTE